jgi:hypothetical protein
MQSEKSEEDLQICAYNFRRHSKERENAEKTHENRRKTEPEKPRKLEK